MSLKDKKLLLVEDEPAHQLVITKALKGFYQYEVASSYQEALQKLVDGQFDLFLLDVMLGDGMGFDLVEAIRSHEKHKNASIVFLTSLSDVTSKVKGFSLGADDYVTKPCDPRELRARLDSKLMKAPAVPVAKEYRVGTLVFCFESQTVCVDQNGTLDELDLTPIEYKLLYYFARHQGQALDRESILNQVWGKNTHVMARSVDTYVAALRKKVKDLGVIIKSVHGVGYRLSLPEPQQKAG